MMEDQKKDFIDKVNEANLRRQQAFSNNLNQSHSHSNNLSHSLNQSINPNSNPFFDTIFNSKKGTQNLLQYPSPLN